MPARQVNEHVYNHRNELLIAISLGDTVQFAEYVERNLRLEQMRNNHPLRPQAAASWVRRAIADSLRTRSPYQVNILLGGYDMANAEAKLYWMDYLGTQIDVPYAAHGGGAYFVLSILDKYARRHATSHFVQADASFQPPCRYHNPQASLEEGLDALKRCVKELQQRLVISFPSFKVKVVDESGVREIELDLTV